MPTHVLPEFGQLPLSPLHTHLCMDLNLTQPSGTPRSYGMTLWGLLEFRASIPIKPPQPYMNINYHDHGFFTDMQWSLGKAGHSPGQPPPSGPAGAGVGPDDLQRCLHTTTIL